MTDMIRQARAAAEEFAKLQGAASPGPFVVDWGGIPSRYRLERWIDMGIDPETIATISNVHEAKANVGLFATARNTPLPALTLKLIERLEALEKPLPVTGERGEVLTFPTGI